MINIKLPKIEKRREKTKNVSLESRDMVSAKLFKGSTYDPLRMIHRTTDSCDKVVLPKMNDRMNIIKKTAQHTKDETFRCSAALEDRRGKYLRERCHLDEEWEMLEKKEHALKTNMIIFNKFLKENLVKRERFEENISHHRRVGGKYDEEIELIREKISVLRKIKKLMKQQIKKHSIYNDFLETVVSRKGEYNCVSSLINRFALLFETLEEAAQKFQSKKKQLETLTLEEEKKDFDRINLIQSLLNKLGYLSVVHATVTAKSKDVETVLSNVQLETERLFHNFAITEDFINDMYLSMCKRQGLEVVFHKGDFDNQLTVIYTCIEMLRNIVESQDKNKG
ncbi:coiled-coil domain-containing protein 42 homolog [Coccinella septempunctata]|uniref:coiled-coil domain-containing protein 42 homolog n=1 Tax=Coccinella septempunctata TaxID=41139 RepID=UPI001D078216|nr:coiled-coil domain-containing protein 42 homolog [Coccinella septempunctata]